MDNLNVEFDNPKAVYLPGKEVKGAVVFHLRVPESFKGLTVECIGKGQVHWSETQTSGRETETVHYQASENYFYHKILLFGEDAKEFPSNTYRYPFSFALPENLPTSFEGVHGSIRYYVRASLNRRYMLDAVFKRGFTVNNVVDLNANPQAQLPINNDETKMVCCWCCQSGPITASVWLPKAGYVPGETILFSGRVDNSSRSRLLSTSVRLVEKTVYKAQSQTKCEERTMVQITRNNQQQHNGASLDVWDKVPIAVPPMAPSGLPNCSIINLSYVLEFVVDPGALSFNFVVPLDIIIGTIPLRNSFETFQPAPSAPVMKGIDQPPPIGFILEPYLRSYPNLPPATTENGMFKGDLREEGDTEHLNIGFDTLFVPNYITFPRNAEPPV